MTRKNSGLPRAVEQQGAERPTRKSGPDAVGERAYLRFLVQSAEDLNSSLDLKEVFRKVAERIKPLVDYHLFCVMLWDEEAGLLEHSFSLCYGEQVPQKGGFPLGHGIGGSCAALRRPIRVPDVLVDPRYVRHRHPEVEIHSELAVPLVVRERLIGVIDLESTEFDAFGEEHEQMLVALASHVATALENARLHEHVQRHEQRLEHDLITARQIQKGLFPEQPPRVEGLEIGLAYAPARELGGDLYDFIASGDGRLAIAVGDVAGKATPAALFGSLAVGILRGNSVRVALDPVDMLHALNDGLLETRIDNRYVALALAVYDVHSRSLSLANAGFPLPVVLHEGTTRKIDVRGIPLGIMHGHGYQAYDLQWKPGDMVVFCSDGLDESLNPDGEELGHERLAEELRSLAGEPAQRVADRLLELTDEHAGASPPHDDRTVVVLKRTLPAD
jgi:sigma-B regulation protein RsbU (phosphoserine phosphatase)